jgi:hypothetical protein
VSFPSNKLVLLGVTLLGVFLPAIASAASSEEDLFFKGVSDVNDGQLNFLAQAPAKPIHHHHNHIFITDDSLTSGWVRLEQCHRNLDPVSSLQVVYSKERTRDITILRTENIGKAWVHEHTVQMEQVEPVALICIRAETRALRADGDGKYSLANGPYMRRFLDGYYPMRVSMDVTLETSKLRYSDITPPPQTGFRFHQQGSELGYEALFEGRLRTVIQFTEAR